MVSNDSECHLLRSLAIRIWSTPANSVPSERAFSAQNFIHTKLRNSLSATNVDKLVYIYMNSRYFKNLQKSPFSLTEQELVQLENAELSLDHVPIGDEEEVLSKQDTDDDQEIDKDMSEMEEEKEEDELKDD